MPPPAPRPPPRPAAARVNMLVLDCVLTQRHHPVFYKASMLMLTPRAQVTRHRTEILDQMVAEEGFLTPEEKDYYHHTGHLDLLNNVNLLKAGMAWGAFGSEGEFWDVAASRRAVVEAVHGAMRASMKARAARAWRYAYQYTVVCISECARARPWRCAFA